MTQLDDGPINITHGNSVFFTAEFYDANGETDDLVTSATLSVLYTNANYETQMDSVVLSSHNRFFVGTWSSSNSIPELALWAVMPSSNPSPAQLGTIRIVGP